MGGHGVVGHVEPAGNLTGGEAVRLLFHKQPKSLKPRRLGKGRESVNCEILFHMSGIIDGYCDNEVTVLSQTGRPLCLRALLSTLGQFTTKDVGTCTDLFGDA